jgi:hypothetical protein
MASFGRAVFFAIFIVVGFVGEILLIGLGGGILSLFFNLRDPGPTFLIAIPAIFCMWVASKAEWLRSDVDAIFPLMAFAFVFGGVFSIAYMFNGLAAFVVLCVGAAFLAKPFIHGWNYLFVEHPAEPVVGPALQTQSPINPRELKDALTTGRAELENPLPAYHYRNQTERAEALKEKLQADAEIAEAAIRRERARAALAEAERELAEAKHRKEKRP